MYTIVDGRVRVHNGHQTLNELGEREVFGEMAALDAAPRRASIIAIQKSFVPSVHRRMWYETFLGNYNVRQETRLFRLEQSALFDLVADQFEVAHGIIHILSRNLRARPHDIKALVS